MTKLIKLAAISSVLFAGSAFAAAYPTTGSEALLGSGTSVESASVYTGLESVEFQGANLSGANNTADLYTGSK